MKQAVVRSRLPIKLQKTTRAEAIRYGVEPGLLDFALSALFSLLTVYSLGMAVTSTVVTWVLCVLSVLGSVVGWLLHRTVRRSKVLDFHGLFYTAAMLTAFFSASNLNANLPDNPFTGQLAVSGALAWMVILGGAFAWRDQTLLFQAVPCIALFGLIGCYDTYRDATFAFFGFLLCFGTLLARIHARSMLRRSIISGWTESDDSVVFEYPSFPVMHKGPWKWAAGPEWALLSAGLVVLVSLISAPIIQDSVKGVAGFVHVTPPPSAAPKASQSNPLGSGARIGTGPNAPSGKPVLRATLDQPRFLRAATFQTYTGTGWSSIFDDGRTTNIYVQSDLLSRAAVQRIKNPFIINFRIEMMSGQYQVVPSPGEVVQIQTDDQVAMRLDGILQTPQRGVDARVTGVSYVPNPRDKPKNAVRNPNAISSVLLSLQSADRRVVALAKEVTKGAKDDYDKAIRLEAEIDRRAKYNIDAPETPAGIDPVYNFLFKSHEGYCDLFASSMVLMARSVGIPARYVTGYYVFHKDDRDEHGRYIVRDYDAHGWAELYFEDVGWVVFDATEGADFAPGAGPGSFHGGPWLTVDFGKRVLDYAIGLTLLIALAAWGRAYLLALKRTPAQAALDEVGREYKLFNKVLSTHSGRIRRPAQTPQEYLEVVRGSLGGGYELAKGLTDVFVSTFYSSGDVPLSRAQTLKEQRRLLQAELRKQPHPGRAGRA